MSETVTVTATLDGKESLPMFARDLRRIAFVADMVKKTDSNMTFTAKQQGKDGLTIVTASVSVATPSVKSLVETLLEDVS